MSGRRIGLLVVGHVDERSRHVAGDYPELFGAILPRVELVRFDLTEDRFPESARDCDGWLCSPSRSSVYEPLAWIADAEDLLREIVAAGRPYVGICFGHQLLARALGAPVERNVSGWQVGVHDYQLVETPPWMDPPVDRVSLVASHQDQVTSVPDGARLLARSDTCAVAGLAVGDRAWTLQGHPEFAAPLADHLLAGRVQLIGAERVATARASLSRPLDRDLVGRWVGRFLESS